MVTGFIIVFLIIYAVVAFLVGIEYDDLGSGRAVARGLLWPVELGVLLYRETLSIFAGR